MSIVTIKIKDLHGCPVSELEFVKGMIEKEIISRGAKK